MSPYAWPVVALVLIFVAALLFERWAGKSKRIGALEMRHMADMVTINTHSTAVDETLRILNAKLTALQNRLGAPK